MNPKFGDQTISIESVFGRLTVTVTHEALRTLWREGVGPQDGRGLIAANYDMIAQVATTKFEADEGEDDHAVRVTDADLEA